MSICEALFSGLFLKLDPLTTLGSERSMKGSHFEINFSSLTLSWFYAYTPVYVNSFLLRKYLRRQTWVIGRAEIR